MVHNKAAVIGYPVKHSISPLIHGYWLHKYNLNGEYKAIEVDPDSLKDFIYSLKEGGDYRGINVTVPFKEKVFTLIDEVDETARKIGAVNTIYLKNNRLLGTNTDGYGFICGIERQIPEFDFKDKQIVVLGAGGAARAVIYGLASKSVGKIIIANRNRQRAELLQNIYPYLVEVRDWQDRDNIIKNCDMLVNTTTLGMVGQEPLEIDLGLLPQSAIVADIVYKPLITNLLKAAQDQGNKTVDGMWMLLYQAVMGFQLFFGQKPEVTDELRKQCLEFKSI